MISLQPRELLVNLMIDEVYTCKRVEYSGGSFFGYENQTPTSTLLCFMIKSVAGRYQDMVSMTPVARLDAALLSAQFAKVIEKIAALGFDVVSVSVDGHSANRKFYTDLCGGVLQASIAHPQNADSRVHLLFDSVHVFKNLFNNFLNRREFACPPFHGDTLAPKFRHIEELYHLELGHPVKYAHKLNDKVLKPMPIERTKVELADRLFHESTIAALDYYAAHGHPKWKETANFLRLIRTWWNTVNVRNPTMGKRMRDPVREPVRLDDMGAVQFLERFFKWLKEWQETAEKRQGLSSETFMCCAQATRGLSSLAIYLLEEKNLDYVLFGQITSDPLEKRFGWYRQLGGANYFLSVRQFLESEKKIRLQCLVKMGNLSFSEVKDVLQTAQKTEDTEEEAKKLLADLPEEFDEDMNFEDEEGILFYVAK
jgi:hypothetical protein